VRKSIASNLAELGVSDHSRIERRLASTAGLIEDPRG